MIASIFSSVSTTQMMMGMCSPLTEPAPTLHAACRETQNPRGFGRRKRLECLETAGDSADPDEGTRFLHPYRRSGRL